MTIKAVIFDLDGTITEPYFDFDAIREEMGLDRNVGPIWEEMEKMNPQRRKRMEQILHFHEQRAVEESTLNDGTRETLSRLGQAGIHIGILTRNRKENALAVAKMHDLQFDAIIGREDGPVKPDAFGVLELCSKFGVKAVETIVVGDFLFDLQCANAAGAISVLLKNNKMADEFAEHADFTIEKISGVLEIIKEKKESVN